jgi:excisionase family DNA binding protein
MPDADDFMTVAEVVSILKLNQQTVRNWIHAGKLPALHIGGRVRMRRSDVDALIADGAVGGDSRPAGPSIWDGDIPQPQPPAHLAQLTLSGAEVDCIRMRQIRTYTSQP